MERPEDFGATVKKPKRWTVIPKVGGSNPSWGIQTFSFFSLFLLFTTPPTHETKQNTSQGEKILEKS